MAHPDTRSNERACDGCPFPTLSDLPEGRIHDEAQRKKIEAEASELKAREQLIREMRQLREGMVRDYISRKAR